MRPLLRVTFLALSLSCATSEESPATPGDGCDPSILPKIEDGSAEGHADPFGAKAAGQARAGRLRDASQIRVAANAKYRPAAGDFALANGKIAVYIEGARRSDGYNPFGGEMVGLDVVGEDGLPLGRSQFGETLITLSRQAVAPEAVTVIADGSDGKAAIVRARGVLKNIPFLDTFQALLSNEFGFPAAIDYVLEPEAESVLVRFHLVNTHLVEESFANNQIVGFFHAFRHQLFVPGLGFGRSSRDGGDVPWVAFDSPQASFGVVGVASRLTAGLDVSGFQYFSLKGLSLGACATSATDYLRYVPASGGIDALGAPLARVLKSTAPTEVRGAVVPRNLPAGKMLSGAFVHAVDAAGAYVTRAPVAADGSFSLHVPAFPVTLSVTASGIALTDEVTVASGSAAVSLDTPALGIVRVHAKEQGSLRALPVRVQVLPAAMLAAPPRSFGILGDEGGRLHQDYAVSGESELVVPAGTHRVIVTRGYEYELSDQSVAVAPGEIKELNVALEHSVDSTGVMCADFHVHSYYSADSSDDPTLKVKSAVADGLEIPVSSEHEWVIDFLPILRTLGLGGWATSFPSEELTTFAFGHFGILPIQPKPDQPNQGAIDWYGRSPADIFAAVHALPEKPVLVVNHPNGGPNGGAFAAYFTAAAFDRSTAVGKPDLWSEDFDAIEVFNDSDLDQARAGAFGDWLALLDAGKNKWAVGSSDSHTIRTSPVGYPRTCFAFGHDDPQRIDANAVRDAVRAGAGIISGGLSLRVRSPNGKGPGETDAAGAFTVTVEAPSWLSAKELEVIVDGATVETRPLTATVAPGRAARVYTASVDVAARLSRARHYVVFHARGEGDLSPLHPGRKPFAVSNPIFFQ